MELGALLKQARLEAGLSQRQLCGDTITRNMLSQIENGSARPSMDTLRYLAARLEKPVSYFLQEETVSANQALILSARAAFSSGDHSAAMDILSGYAQPDAVFDPEFHLLCSLCSMALAQTSENSLPLLQQAADHGSHTPYYTPELERRRLLLLASAEPEKILSIAADLPSCADELLLRGDAAMSAKDLQATLAWFLLAEPLSPRDAYPRLEACYRSLEDYKMAYHYACKQR